MESFSLGRLNLYIRRVITLNFQELIWVSAELLNLKEKNGHVYLELTEKDDQGNITAQNAAVIWKNTFIQIKDLLTGNIDQILREGNEVRLLVAVDYSVRYGLKLFVQSIDASYTMGKIAQARLQTIEKLKSESLWQKNKAVPMPVAIQNIAIIASKGSAGLVDFQNHLIENQYNYTFNCHLYNVSVQGANTIVDICKAFEKLNKSKSKFDIVVLIRGGGSKHDLLEFDHYNIAREISLMKIPVLTGIGHFVDESIADLSAYQSLKTPTAVADYILSKNHEFELQLSYLMESVVELVKQFVSTSLYRFSILQKDLNLTTKLKTKDYQNELTTMMFLARDQIRQIGFNESKKVMNFNSLLTSNDPNLILQKGYSLTYKNNTLLSKCDLIEVGDEIKTVYKNGTITSNINKAWEQKN